MRSRPAREPLQPVSGAGRAAHARALVGLTRAFAARGTGPAAVLLPARPVAGRRYPEPPLALFGGLGRAYYHAHAAPGLPAGEHGHFHVFLRSDKSEGHAHLAALSVDPWGQPLAWVAVNGWVTGGPWLARGDARRILASLPAPQPPWEADPAAWLEAMVGLYAAALARLLHARDARLARLAAGAGLEVAAARAERRWYVLARRRVRLLEAVARALGGARLRP